MIGQTLGHYQVTGKLGAGGMGVVYRARDTRLGRDVALKMLPEAFLHDSERLARFEREAHVLASLNHPNIATIYGLEESGNGRALVMELAEGATLAERIGSGPVPLEEALVIARQIAEAIEFAHERGIVHRDLKPANVKLTHDNTVKVLDFGLAKAFSEDRLSSDAENSPTITQAATRAGVVLGTAAYMAPEQAKGKPVDRRADIWAFGIVFMEMLTGRQTYSGETAAETLAFVMTRDPALDRLPTETPPAIRRLLRRCLDRDPRRRLRDIGEARIAIEEVLSGTPPEPAVPGGTSSSPSPSRPLVWMASTAGLAVLLLASLAALVGHFRETPPKAATVRFQVPLPEKASLRSLDFPVVSPNGEYLVFAADGGPGSTTGRLLRIQPLNSLSFQDLPGTEGAYMPFWSPDSRSIGFFSQGKLKKVDVTGGPSQTICDVTDGRSGAWSPDGTIVFASGFASGFASPLRCVPAAGGEARPLTALDPSRQEVQHLRPFLLPDGRRFLYLAVSSQPEKSGIYAGSLDSKDTKRLLSSSSHAAYAPGLSGVGYLMFLRANTLMAQPFDSRKLELSGEPFPIAEEVAEAEFFGSAFSVSGNGVLAYRSGGAGGKTELVWFDRSGKRLQSVGDPAVYSSPALSPDEKRLAVDRRDPRTTSRDIWTFDLVRGTASRLTFDSGDDHNAAWSPDGTRIAFASDRKGHRDLYEKLASGTGEDELLVESAERKVVEDWSPDGRFLLYTQGQTIDVWVLPLFGERTPFPFLTTPFNETQPQFSPNGRWVVYNSNESGRSEIYVQAFPPTGDKWQISAAGGSDPQWRVDGKELFYLERQKMMAVPVNTGGPAFEAGIPAALFTPPTTMVSRRNRYAAAANGQRFLVNTVPDELHPVFTVVLNWETGIKR